MKKTAMTNNMEQQLIEMAAILGLDEPVSEEVLLAAVADSTYAHNLLVCRGEPEFLGYLLANPPRMDASNDTETFSTADLLGRAADSLVRWAKTGFSTVTEEIYRKRLMACNACPNLKIPPENQQSLYAIAGAGTNERTVCGKCGCVVTVKARRTSDTCPDYHPNRHDLNRWDEPVLQEG
jgi:hypothetical protein